MTKIARGLKTKFCEEQLMELSMFGLKNRRPLKRCNLRVASWQSSPASLSSIQGMINQRMRKLVAEFLTYHCLEIKWIYKMPRVKHLGVCCEMFKNQLYWYCSTEVQISDWQVRHLKSHLHSTAFQNSRKFNDCILWVGASHL